MNLSSIIHAAKSNLSYAYDESILHIRLKTAKGDVDRVYLRAVDPFNWIPSEENPEIYVFDKDTIEEIEMEKECSTDLYDIWFGKIEKSKTLRIRYVFLLENSKETYIFGANDIINYEIEPEKIDDTSNYFNFPYINHEDVYRCPEWVNDTVWYQIFPDRFCNGNREIDPINIREWNDGQTSNINNLYGGDIEGIISKLDYIKDMGFNGIYFTPIFQASSSHKYDTIDYFTVDKAFGTNEDFKRLVQEAHSRGIKIMLDAVFNHCGYLHPYWQDVLDNGRDSKYFDCFYIYDKEKEVKRYDMGKRMSKKEKDEMNFRTFSFTPAMPKLNTSNPIMREYLLNVAKYWIEEYDIDGWRLDVSNEVSHDFWREFKKVVTACKNDIYILGENWDNSYPWLLGEQFHAVMNYEFTTPLWKFIGIDGTKRKYNAEEYMYAINKLLTNYPKNIGKNMFNLIDSHDTARIVDICGHDINRVKIAYALQMTFGGAPSVYYGGEIGLDGEEHDCRKCMPWDGENHNLELKKYLKKIIFLRKELESFKSMDLKWLYASSETNSLIFEKSSKEENIYVVVNNSECEQEINLPNEMRNKKMKELIEEERTTLGDSLNVKELSVKIFKEL